MSRVFIAEHTRNVIVAHVVEVADAAQDQILEDRSFLAHGWAEIWVDSRESFLDSLETSKAEGLFSIGY